METITMLKQQLIKHKDILQDNKTTLLEIRVWLRGRDPIDREKLKEVEDSIKKIDGVIHCFTEMQT